MGNIDTSHILPPVDIKLILAELTEDLLIRKTNKLDNLVYIINHHNAPNVMREIGRLRELAFTLGGGGTGQEIDIDSRDTSENCYEQLIVFSPVEQVIIGGYRFFDGAKSVDPEHRELSTSSYFYFSDEFVKDYLPYTIELGRSWIHPNYQASVNPRKGLFALDNLWDGLGAIMVINKHMKYFFGKVTMYEAYDHEAKRAVMAFMDKFFPDKDKLVVAKNPIHTDVKNHELNKITEGMPVKEGLNALRKYCLERGEHIPPLINKYMQLSSTMKTFGTAPNLDFGGVEETGILVTIADVYPDKTARHLL